MRRPRSRSAAAKAVGYRRGSADRIVGRNCRGRAPVRKPRKPVLAYAVECILLGSQEPSERNPSGLAAGGPRLGRGLNPPNERRRVAPWRKAIRLVPVPQPEADLTKRGRWRQVSTHGKCVTRAQLQL